MEDTKKVLQMTFATREGGSLRISVDNTLDDLTVDQIKNTMDTIVESNVFYTKSGEVIDKAKARYVTQQIEEIDLA